LFVAWADNDSFAVEGSVVEVDVMWGVQGVEKACEFQVTMHGE
jgi:hypothetical protein